MHWWRRLLATRELERRLDAELRFHFEQQVTDNIRAGMSQEEARRAANLKIGGLESLKEDCRDARGTRWVENLLQDIRFTARSLRRSPSFTLTAVLCLGLGIGANTTIFSVVDALMIRELPVRQPQRLVLLGEGHASGSNDGFPNSPPDLFSWAFLQELRAKNTVFSDVLAIRSYGFSGHARFGGGGTALEPVTAELVSNNYFNLLGVSASVGRVFTPGDTGAALAVLRYGYWQKRFGRDPSVLGRSVTLNGMVCTIVGVAAPEFFGSVTGAAPDFWVPLRRDSEALNQSLWLIGRMKPGVTVAMAEANTNVLFRQWLHTVAGLQLSPERLRDMQRARVILTDASRGLSRLRREFSRPLQILMVLVGLVLLITCANIANLLLARATSRLREISVRIALGASRRRLLVQLLSESLFLALIGGGLGILLSPAAIRLLLVIVSRGPQPVPLEAGLNTGVLLFTFALSLLTGVVFGIAPALHLTRVDAGPALKEGKGMGRSRAQKRFGKALVAVQVALAFFLTVGAGLFVISLRRLEQTNVGFDKAHVLLFRLDSDSSARKGAALQNAYRRLLTSVQAMPGVQAASFSEVTFDEGHWRTMVWPEGVARSEATAKTFNGDHVGADYFRVLGTPLALGRGFDRRDTAKSPAVAIVNETFARSLFPNESPLGRRFFLERDSTGYEIIGVVRDARYESVRERPMGAFFVYNEQDTELNGYSDLLVRTETQPGPLTNAVRRTIHAETPDLAISLVRTLAEQVDASLGRERLLADLAGSFGILALLLAALGLYGVIAYSVARRTHEIGIRIALGARPANIAGSVLCESLSIVSLGLICGLAAALFCGHFVASQLYGVSADDPLSIGGAAALLFATALIASLLPGRRAALLDPLAALRQE